MEKESNTKQTQISFEQFCDLITTLRAPNGCPWDAKQTHESLKRCMTEEAAEVNAAIRIYERTGDDSNLCEELGDVLLQVVMHSQIAKEENRFSIEDVILGIYEKMIRRHPHVFSDVTVESTSDVLKNWEEIKKEEKKQKGQPIAKNRYREVPLEMPVLARGQKILKRIDQANGKELSYEDLNENIGNLFAQMQEIEKTEYSKHSENSKNKKRLVGNLLLETINLARYWNINANEELEDVLEEKIAWEESSKKFL